MLQIEWPWALLLLPLPLLVYFFIPPHKQSEGAALRVPFVEDFRFSQQPGQRQHRHRWLKYLGLLAWCLLVLSASRPQWLGDAINIPVSGRNLMIAVDLSNSMRAEDFDIKGEPVNRLVATKAVATQFIKNRGGDRIGLILFGSAAYLQAPLTFDTKTVNQLLLESEIGLAGERTAIGDAIGLALKRLEANTMGEQVLILMTDGANTAGEVTPLKAAQLAAQRGLKIYTIGIGGRETGQRSWFGLGQSSQAPQLDEKTLREIANITGGRYFRAHNTQKLAEIYALLGELEPIDKDVQSFRPTGSLYYWPLATALFLAAFIVMIRPRLS